MKLKINNIDLPSNKRFGLFFSLILLCISLYLFLDKSINASILSFILSFAFLITSLIKENLLLPLNKLWMSIGFLLGAIFSPIILGLIFYGILTPMALVMKLAGRDELKLKHSHTLWIDRKHRKISTQSFKKQF